MLLAIDAGNTNIVFGLFEKEVLRETWRLETKAEFGVDDFRAALQPLFRQAGIEFGHVTGCVVASVVPAIDDALRRLCADVFGFPPVFADAATAGLPIRLDRPAEVGADRLVNAVATVRDYSVPAIIIDFGTATTFDVVDDSGAYRGGVIAPGPNLSAEALYQAAAKLPRVAIGRPPDVIGTDTVSAMQSGLFWGYIGLIEGLVSRIAAELGASPFVVATGGLAGLYASATPVIAAQDPDLTLRGLSYIYDRLRG